MNKSVKKIFATVESLQNFQSSGMRVRFGEQDESARDGEIGLIPMFAIRSQTRELAVNKEGAVTTAFSCKDFVSERWTQVIGEGLGDVKDGYHTLDMSQVLFMLSAFASASAIDSYTYDVLFDTVTKGFEQTSVVVDGKDGQDHYLYLIFNVTDDKITLIVNQKPEYFKAAEFEQTV